MRRMRSIVTGALKAEESLSDRLRVHLGGISALNASPTIRYKETYQTACKDDI